MADPAVVKPIAKDRGTPPAARTCADFNRYVRDVGVKDAHGKEHPGWAGVTTFDLAFRVGRASAAKRVTRAFRCTQAGNVVVYFSSIAACTADCHPVIGTIACVPVSGEVCLEVTVPVELGATVRPTRLDWKPADGAARLPGCAAEKARWDAAVEAHEAHHASQVQALLEAERAKQGSGKTFVACAPTEPDARRKLKQQVDEYRAGGWRKDAAQTAARWEAEMNAWHTTPAGQPLIEINCGICGGAPPPVT